MIYDLKDIEKALGRKFNPKHDYCLARRADITPKEQQGWTKMGTLPDFSGDKDGVMTIMARPSSKD